VVIVVVAILSFLLCRKRGSIVSSSADELGSAPLVSAQGVVADELTPHQFDNPLAETVTFDADTAFGHDAE
jgi:hypothetical protein